MLTTNSKLKKDGIVAFNLPAIKTCPGAGDCVKYCYARRGRYVFPNVIKAHAWNYTASKSDWFAGAMNDELKKSKARYVRLHTSGDFYSQEYLDKWIEIMRANPDKKFYCYTKSLHLDWSEADTLPNFARTQSVGGKFDADMVPGISRTYVLDTLENKTEFDMSDLTAAVTMFSRGNVILKKR